MMARQSFLTQTSGTEQSVTTQEEIEDDIERLIATIKRSAAEYISGYAQLHSSQFKKEAKTSQGLSTFFHKKYHLDQIKEGYLVRDFVDNY